MRWMWGSLHMMLFSISSKKELKWNLQSLTLQASPKSLFINLKKFSHFGENIHSWRAILSIFYLLSINISVKIWTSMTRPLVFNIHENIQGGAQNAPPPCNIVNKILAWDGSQIMMHFEIWAKLKNITHPQGHVWVIRQLECAQCST